MTPEAIVDGLGTRLIGRRVICLERTPSTNDRVWAELGHHAREGLVVVAEEQTHGRGRLGRAWHSPRGAGVWMSVLLRPEMPIERLPLLTSMAAMAVAAAVASMTPLSPRIRWPNDVHVGGRKLAGVLVETRDLSAPRPAAVLGIGLNVDIAREAFPPELRKFATSLSAELGTTVNRVRLIRSLLGELDHLYAEVCSNDLEAFAERWRSLLDLLGDRVRVKERGRWHTGRLIDIDPIEGVFLRTDPGAPRRFRLEHVEMLRPVEGTP